MMKNAELNSQDDCKRKSSSNNGICYKKKMLYEADFYYTQV